jgi:ATP synthase protein I
MLSPFAPEELMALHDPKGLTAFADYGTVGLNLVLSILLGFAGGRWLDGKLGTNGVLTVIGFGFGVVAGFRFLYQAAVKMRKETEVEDERERRSQGDDREPPAS